MIIEVPILKGDKCFSKFIRNRIYFRKTPLLVICNDSTEESTIACVNRSTIRRIEKWIRQTKPKVEPEDQGGKPQQYVFFLAQFGWKSTYIPLIKKVYKFQKPAALQHAGLLLRPIKLVSTLYLSHNHFLFEGQVVYCISYEV